MPCYALTSKEIQMYYFFLGAFLTSGLILFFMASSGMNLTLDTPMVIWAIYTGVGLLATALLKSA
jgi:hypothetical protein